MHAGLRAAFAWPFERESGDPDRATLAKRFSRSLRLTTGEDFAGVFAARMSARSATLIVHGRLNGLPYGRLGLTVGRRTERRATRRNYMKRVIRDIFRLFPDSFSGADWVVAPRRTSFNTAARPDIQRELLELAQVLQARWRNSCKS
jgi:ribonuclease P protein component